MRCPFDHVRSTWGRALQHRGQEPYSGADFAFYSLTKTQISSRTTKDSHSGIDGGGWDEPMRDM